MEMNIPLQSMSQDGRLVFLLVEVLARDDFRFGTTGKEVDVVGIILFVLVVGNFIITIELQFRFSIGPVVGGRAGLRR